MRTNYFCSDNKAIEKKKVDCFPFVCEVVEYDSR